MGSEFHEELISAYLDDEVSPEERASIRQQIDSDPAAERMLADFQEMGNLLRSLPSEKAPSGMVAAVHQQIERQTLLPASDAKAGKNRRRPLWLTGSTAALLLIGCCSLFFYRWTASLDQTANTGALDDQAIARTEGLEALKTELPTLEDDTLNGHLAMGRAAGGDGDSAAPAMMMSSTELKLDAPIDSIPAPPISQALEQRVLAQLNDSRKLAEHIQPGDLVRFVSESGQDVAVVELSVVDVADACGRLQLLLVSNDIQGVGVVSLPSAKDRNSGRFEPEPAAPGEPVPLQKGTSEKLAGEPRSGGDDELVALYVDASVDQVLNSLSAMTTLEGVQKVHFGEAPNLMHDAYAVVPLGADSPSETESLDRAAAVPSDEERKTNEEKLGEVIHQNAMVATERFYMAPNEVSVNSKGRAVRFIYTPQDHFAANMASNEPFGDGIAGVPLKPESTPSTLSFSDAPLPDAAADLPEADSANAALRASEPKDATSYQLACTLRPLSVAGEKPQGIAKMNVRSGSAPVSTSEPDLPEPSAPAATVAQSELQAPVESSPRRQGKKVASPQRSRVMIVLSPARSD
ncbi:anti-sigma factor family protein [Rubinisphaera margarita]|uniref:anti-sigma factor family protein n=1 Tax=Rubinisphaera margarita TaxID=2909586 RepID=UPI001EE7E705|nr:hypothetical protein [Rubinisphaera margarita]MCG6156872.1 hypothetical protein [Rubinisphaera margarita]